MLIRSQDRPKGKLIYDSEKYHGTELDPNMMSSNPDAVIAQFGNTEDAEYVPA